MEADALAVLHAPLIPILRHCLAVAPLPRAGVALDLACGPGHKTPLLAEACGPDVRLIGIDEDAAAVRAATTDQQPPYRHDISCPDREPRTGRQKSAFVGVVGDALALPLRDGCCDAAFCIAALSLFADRRLALRELRRALRPGGLALLVVGTQTWAQIIRWPCDIAERVSAAYAQALASGSTPLPATPDLGADLANLLGDAGFDDPLVRAFTLGPTVVRARSIGPRPPTIDLRPAPCALRPVTTTDNRRRTTDNPLESELPLLPWPSLRPLLAGRLSAVELARCDRLAAEAEIELCPLVLIAYARAR
ncbi:MAG TPA: class I SAM-dependent methyltransferase [Roseiflexaceae bacterium]